MEKSIYRHETGRTVVVDDMYRQLYLAVYDASAHELFGDNESHSGPSPEHGFFLTSHKFVPAFVGTEGESDLRKALNGHDASWDWTTGWQAVLPHPQGQCNVYGFPWGVVVFHIEEQVAHTDIAHVAEWRQRTHAREQAWVDAEIRLTLGANSAESEYVLSLFWVHRHSWPHDVQETAMRILCTPSVLLNARDHESGTAHAELVEQSLLRHGFDDPRIVNFGVQGVSIGYASWSGVVYHPLHASRALDVERLAVFEAVVQGLWAYCLHVRSEIEGGHDPQVPDQFGWRWLRAMRSKMEGPRPRETGQHCAMREAILQTSGLSQHLVETLDVVRESKSNSFEEKP